MKPNISEFSYGYALTDELIHAHGAPITGAPVFPSLYQEGQKGGGWDLKLPQVGVPLFLQFKLADFIKRRNAKEYKAGMIGVPFYRMHLRPSRFSRQHQLLLDLEQAGEEVYYSAPAFHDPDELNDAYLNAQVKQRSLWIKPSDIGALPSSGDHHIAFCHPGPWFICSEPRQIFAEKGFDRFLVDVKSRIDREGRTALSEPKLAGLAEKIANIAERRPDISYERKATARRQLVDAPPLRRVAYYASVFLECQLFVASEPQSGAAV